MTQNMKRPDSRKQSIQHSLSSQQWMIGRQLLRDRTHLSDRPHLDHSELLLHPLELQLHHHILAHKINTINTWKNTKNPFKETSFSGTHIDVVVAGGSQVGHSASVFGWEHNLVLDEGVLKHRAVDVTPRDVTANLQ